MSHRKGMMFIDVMIASTPMSALSDTGGIDFFMSYEFVKNVGLKVKSWLSYLKTVNSHQFPTGDV